MPRTLEEYAEESSTDLPDAREAAMRPKLEPADPHRASQRQRLRRQIAECEVARLRMNALQGVLNQLAADSEAAADSHSEQSGRLQAELKELDRRHVDALLSSKTPGEKQLARRAEIMLELSRLNSALESRCDSNKRAAVPVQREFNELRLQVGKIASLENELADLAPDAIRRERLLIDIRTQVHNVLVREIERRLAIAEHNRHVHEDLNREPEKATVFHQKKSDFKWMLDWAAKDLVAMKQRDTELHRQALEA